MPALEAGVQAPDIDLQYLDGRKFSLKDVRKQGPVVAAFFKVSCPVCQLAFPYLERVFKAYEKSGKFTFVGVSEDDPADTRSFNREFGVTFPVVIDPEDNYPASNAYGLTNVPGAAEPQAGKGERDSASADFSSRRNRSRVQAGLRVKELARGRG
jgi:peroxiredoxin